MILLNKKAYELYTKQNADTIFKDKVLKRVDITDTELKELNLTDTSEQKVFTCNKVGIGRVFMDGDSKVIQLNEYLSDDAYQIGRDASNY